MRIDVVTIFPDLISDVTGVGIMGRGIDGGHVDLHVHNLRDFCHDRHKQVDDTPYGGGPGMVMKPEPFFEAVEGIRADVAAVGPVLLPTPQGELFSQAKASSLAKESQITVLCARYEGIDERVREAIVDEEISIGDYVLSGGELPALVIIDAVVRLVSGVLGNEESLVSESHAGGLLEHPQYTRPAEYAQMEVPEILQRGAHEEIRRWRRRESLRRTLKRRPDLLVRANLTHEDWELLGEL
ncbi:MAG: tRNA (guanosine(37)-N1)-methyltransferase TrmD [Armatimonadota bacterium]